MWKIVTDYAETYRINEQGIVHAKRNGKWVLFEPSERKSGQSRQLIFEVKRKDGTRYRISAKRFVWTAFFGPVPSNMHVCFIVKEDGLAIKNLMLVKTGKSVSVRTRRPVAAIDRNGTVVEVYPSVLIAAKKNNLSPASVRYRCSKKMKDPFSWYQYTFQYDDERKSTGS